MTERISKTNWTADELEQLQELASQNLTDKEMGGELNRSMRAVRAKRLELQMHKRGKRKEWTEEEELKLSRMFWGGSTDREIAKELKRTKEAIKNRRLILGLLKGYLE